MNVGVVVRWLTCLPVVSVLCLIGCTPRGPRPLPIAAPEPLTDHGGYETIGAGGRFYALGQALAREQQHTAALTQEVQRRDSEIERLQNEVRQLTEKQDALRVQLEAATNGGGSGLAAVLPARAAVPADDRTSQELEHLKQQAAEAAAMAAGLRADLSREQERRTAAEIQLQRLKEETTTPPYATANAGIELASARQELGDLRTALADERAQRARLAGKLHQLEQQAEAAPTNAADADLQRRIDALQKEKDDLVQSFNRSLAASQRRTNELEQQLTSARSTASSPGAGAPDATRMQAENAALRSRLDEEHHRTEELAAKLKMASRVADLIFKMQAQQPAAEATRR